MLITDERRSPIFLFLLRLCFYLHFLNPIRLSVSHHISRSNSSSIPLQFPMFSAVPGVSLTWINRCTNTRLLF